MTQKIEFEMIRYYDLLMFAEYYIPPWDLRNADLLPSRDPVTTKGTGY